MAERCVRERKPTLSVVMAVRDGAQFVNGAIDSVLAQSMADFEFLIVDDASTDDTGRILADYERSDPRVRVFRNERVLGPFSSANVALHHAQGTYIARHDADDFSYPERFAVQLEALESDPHACLVTGPIEVVDALGRTLLRIHQPGVRQSRLEWDLLFGNSMATSANVMFPRVFRGMVIQFAAEHLFAEDYDLCCKLSRFGRVVCLSGVLYRYRQHSLSITNRKRAQQEECALGIRRSYVSNYLGSEGLSEQSLAELVHFWTTEGSTPLTDSVCTIGAMLDELQRNFLAYVQQRYGHAERALLESELRELVSARLSYWLCRSVRFRNVKVFQELLAMACARRELARVSAGALHQIVDALYSRIRIRRRSLRGKHLWSSSEFELAGTPSEPAPRHV